jgi:hypothetical protein
MWRWPATTNPSRCSSVHLSAGSGTSPTRARNFACTASSSPRSAQALWAELQAERLKGMTLFARALHDDGHLRPGVSPREARDVLWTYNSAELFQLLVLERGWSPKRYGRWVADAMTSALLA